MTTEIQNFLTAQGHDAQTITNILENRLEMAIWNIKKDDKKKLFSFTTITDFKHIENTTIEFELIPLWEAFINFRHIKNATNTLTAIAEGKKFDNETYKNASKITPKAGAMKGLYFNDFLATLTDEQIETICNSITDHLEENLQFEKPLILDHIKINTEGLKKGEYLQYNIEGNFTTGRILTTQPNGWIVLCADDGVTDTLTSATTYKKIDAKKLSKETIEAIDKKFAIYDGNAEDQTQKNFEKLIKTTARAEAQAEKSRLHAEKLAGYAERRNEAEKAKNAQFAKLEKMKLGSEKQILKAIEELKASTLKKEQRATIQKNIREAKAELKKLTATAKPQRAKAPKKETKNIDAITKKANAGEQIAITDIIKAQTADRNASKPKRAKAKA